MGHALQSPCVSVCGWLCGQTQNRLLYHGDKVPEIQQNRPFLYEKSGYCGAARQIRTADLILTKDALYRLSYSSKWRRGRDLNPRPPA